MQHLAAPQHSVAGGAESCTPQALDAVLHGLKAHADRYVAALLALRGDYLAMGRRGKDVEDSKDGFRIRAKRYDTQGELRAYGLRGMVAPPPILPSMRFLCCACTGCGAPLRWLHVQDNLQTDSVFSLTLPAPLPVMLPFSAVNAWPVCLTGRGGVKVVSSNFAHVAVGIMHC